MEDVYYIIIEKENKKGLMDTTGKITIPIEYDEIEDFNETLVRATVNNKSQLLNKNTGEQISKAYDSISELKWIGNANNVDGTLSTRNVYVSLVYNIKDDIKLFGFIDSKGREIIKPIYYNYSFNNDNKDRIPVIILHEAKQLDINDIQNKSMIYFPSIYYLAKSKFDSFDLSTLSEFNLIITKLDKKLGLMNYSGVEIVPPEYDNLSIIDKNIK